MRISLLFFIFTYFCAAADLWEGEPIRYSASAANDPVSELQRELAKGTIAAPSGSPVEKVRWFLQKLKIPEESQILVFSKTSKQNARITPSTPRAIYFNENMYAAFVPGGDMEIISHDPQLGPVFHLISLESGSSPPVFQRETASCLSCHANARTKDVPGVLIRSVFPAADGRPILDFGSHDITDPSPLSERWGGYYVTGRSSQAHLGNQIFTEDSPPAPGGADVMVSSVDQFVSPGSYPQRTSDMVALLLIEHQTHIYNLITRASYDFRREQWMRRVFQIELSRSQVLHDNVEALVAALLFQSAASLGDGVEGAEKFQTAFRNRFPQTTSGKSLADFHLGERLMKNRCSYMIYSQPFRDLPQTVRLAVFQRIKQILRSPVETEGFTHLDTTERKRIDRILVETLPEYQTAG